MRSIVTVIKGPGFGDFLAQVAAASILKLKAPQSRLFAVVSPANRVQAESLLLSPFIDYFIYARPDFPIQYFTDCTYESYSDVPLALRGNYAYEQDGSLSVAPLAMLLGHSDYLLVRKEIQDNVVLAVPPDQDAEATRKLVTLGLSPDRWFACLHIRENGYRKEGGFHPRSVHNLEPYLALIWHIIHEQGGQVVRLGDASMTPLSPMPGLVDLCAVPDSFFLQMSALSHARYLVGSDSGPVVFAWATAIPTFLPNSVSAGDPRCALFPHTHAVSTKTFILDDGRRVRDREAVAMGLGSEFLWYKKPGALEENSADTLITGADLMLRKTADTPGWAVRPPTSLGTDNDEAWFERMGRTGWNATHLPVTFLSDVVP